MEKVLIVDDIPEYVDTIEAYVEDRFKVLKAGSLDDAKNILATNSLSMAIIDIRLNEEDPDNKEGLKLVKWLKVKSPEVKIIVMSAYKEFDFALEALNDGADYFMRKPLDPDELTSTIDKLL